MTPLVALDDVSRTFHTAAGSFEALKHVDLTLDPGDYVAMVGSSGSGKSTLINVLSGIDRPTSGRVRLADTDLGALGESRLARFRGAYVGIVFQFFQLIPTLTARENVVLAMDLVGRVPRSERRGRALELLEKMGVAGHAGKLPSQLSGGEQQRVAIARALANDPKILVADEPTGNLDSENGERIHALFGQCAAGGRTVLVATHERDGLDRYSRRLSITDGVLEEVARA